MKLAQQVSLDITQIGCPHCPGQHGLELALRVELETEASIYVASCPSCQRIYRVEPNGKPRFREVDINQLKLDVVHCPACRATGYAMTLDFLRDDVESYTILTCQDCSHTFRSDGNRLPAAT